MVARAAVPARAAGGAVGLPLRVARALPDPAAVGQARPVAAVREVPERARGFGIAAGIQAVGGGGRGGHVLRAVALGAQQRVREGGVAAGRRRGRRRGVCHEAQRKQHRGSGSSALL